MRLDGVAWACRSWVALLVMSVAACGGTDPERDTDGPLQVAPPYTQWFEVQEGEEFSDGMTILSASKTITIDRVSITGDTDALTFLGARIGLPGRPDDFNQRMPGFPPQAVPSRFQIAAEGATLLAGETYMLILGFRVDGREVSVRQSIEVDYTVGSSTYTASLPGRLVTCLSPIDDDQCSEKYPHPTPH